MHDLIESTLRQIEQKRLPGIELDSDLTHPAYDGLSILNLPASISQWLGAGPLAHPALQVPTLDQVAEGIEQVVLVLVDAVSLDRCLRWLDSSAGSLNTAMQGGLITTLTSIVPSTTSAALTTLWTGRSPAEHGILGYEIFLREFGLIANMITHAPASIDGNAGLLYEAGLTPEDFLPVDTVGPHFADAGIQTHAFLHQAISGSGLSRMHYQQVQKHTFRGLADLWLNVRRLVNSPLESRRYIWVYYGAVDWLSHLIGPDSEDAEVAFKIFTDVLVEQFLNHVEPANARKTLFMLVADHGQLHTTKDPHYELKNHPDLSRRLQMVPTGENRLAYLYPKPGQLDAVDDYIQRNWPGMFSVIPSSHALHSGLFGPGEASPRSLDRLGERVVITHGGSYLWWAPKDNPLVGRHGGVSREEMLVPLLAKRLG
ncbi:MAG: alkaline phosphatase family protein [Anaerolineales bacterium]|nr:alkaline phosphatase family protein [Anaerolineales bacterium]